MRFWHLNLTLGASLIASSASIIPGAHPPSISSRRHSSSTGPRVAALIPAAGFRRGLVRTLSSTFSRTHTFPHVTADRRYSVSHRDCPVAGGPPNQVVSPLPAPHRVRGPLPAIEPLGSQRLRKRLDAVTPDSRLPNAHLSLAS